MKKKILSIILIVIIVMIVSITTTYATNYLYNSNEVYYDNTNSNIASSDVQGAIDELYTEATNYSNINTRVTSLEDNKANLSSPVFTGTPSAPTATKGTNTTQLATTAFVNNTLSWTLLYGSSVTIPKDYKDAIVNVYFTYSSYLVYFQRYVTRSEFDSNNVILNMGGYYLSATDWGAISVNVTNNGKTFAVRRCSYAAANQTCNISVRYR